MILLQLHPNALYFASWVLNIMIAHGLNLWL